MHQRLGFCREMQKNTSRMDILYTAFQCTQLMKIFLLSKNKFTSDLTMLPFHTVLIWFTVRAHVIKTYVVTNTIFEYGLPRKSNHSSQRIQPKYTYVTHGPWVLYVFNFIVDYTNVYSRAYKNYGRVLSTCVTTERNCRSDSFVLILTSLWRQLQQNI